jgi:glycolate oxidase iron-sulfur subunit
MQTNFTPAQLEDPDIAESNSILRACVHCGFCTATCPTYVLTGDELDGPRGRIYLIKDMLESGAAAGNVVTRHIDRCLSCLSCMTTCPSGVNYMHLVDHARRVIEETRVRPWFERTLRGALVAVLPDPARFRRALALARFAAWLAVPFKPLLPRRLKAMLALVPARRAKALAFQSGPRRYPAQGPPRARVALLAGCVQQTLAPEINAATIRVLVRHGCEVLVSGDTGCCGALAHHLGRERPARDAASANIAAWMREIEGDGLDAVIINASGCGTMVKDYGFLFRNDPELAASAGRIAALARDVSEFLAGLDLRPQVAVDGLKIAYQPACSLAHGQKITAEPKVLLAACGFDVTDIADGHLCCGSAGTYNILQPEIAATLRAQKLEAIGQTGADAVASGNIGCISQLGPAAGMPVVHTVELLDWATGGPKPPALEMALENSKGEGP